MEYNEYLFLQSLTDTELRLYNHITNYEENALSREEFEGITGLTYLEALQKIGL